MLRAVHSNCLARGVCWKQLSNLAVQASAQMLKHIEQHNSSSRSKIGPNPSLLSILTLAGQRAHESRCLQASRKVGQAASASVHLCA